MNKDSLAELPESLLNEFLPKLRLSDQNDLKQFLFIRFQIGKEAQMFERIEGEILRFVDYEDNVLVRINALEQYLVEMFEKVVPVPRFRLVTQFSQYGFEQLGFRKSRIQNERRVPVVRIELLEQFAAQGGLSATDLPREDDKPLPFL